MLSTFQNGCWTEKPEIDFTGRKHIEYSSLFGEKK